MIVALQWTNNAYCSKPEEDIENIRNTRHQGSKRDVRRGEWESSTDERGECIQSFGRET
jgi:hypothetical protein